MAPGRRRNGYKQLRNTRPRGYNSGRAKSHPTTELKAFDVAFTNSAFTAAGVYQSLNLPVNGPEIYQRIGRKIYMKSIHIRGHIFNSSTAQQDVARVLLIYDSQSNAGVPVLANILQDSNAAAASTGLSHLNLVNRQRFKVLKDYQVTLPSVTNTANVLSNGPVLMDPIENTFNINWFVKLRGLETIFNATNGGTSADISSGNILLVTVSASAGSTWNLAYSSRLRYYD